MRRAGAVDKKMKMKHNQEGSLIRPIQCSKSDCGKIMVLYGRKKVSYKDASKTVKEMLRILKWHRKVV